MNLGAFRTYPKVPPPTSSFPSLSPLTSLHQGYKPPFPHHTRATSHRMRALPSTSPFLSTRSRTLESTANSALLPFIHSFAHSFIHSFIRSFLHSTIHSLIYFSVFHHPSFFPPTSSSIRPPTSSSTSSSILPPPHPSIHPLPPPPIHPPPGTTHWTCPTSSHRWTGSCWSCCGTNTGSTPSPPPTSSPYTFFSLSFPSISLSIFFLSFLIYLFLFSSFLSFPSTSFFLPFPSFHLSPLLLFETTTSSNHFFQNAEYTTAQILDLSGKLEQAETSISRGSYLMPHDLSTAEKSEDKLTKATKDGSVFIEKVYCFVILDL